MISRKICVLVIKHSTLLLNKKHFLLFFKKRRCIALEFILRRLAKTSILQRFQVQPLETNKKKPQQARDACHTITLSVKNIHFTAFLEDTTRVFLVCRRSLNGDQYLEYQRYIEITEMLSKLFKTEGCLMPLVLKQKKSHLFYKGHKFKNQGCKRGFSMTFYTDF